MAEIDHDGITIDRCIYCNGLWFDHQEIDKLLHRKGSEVIDRGASRTGSNYDTIKKIMCPRCNIPMIEKKDSDKDPFTYETCAQCNGIFLDAGEFKKMKARPKGSIFDYLKTILNK